jgi:hypothetical protein
MGRPTWSSYRRLKVDGGSMHLDKDYVLSSRRMADMEYAAFSSSLFRHVLPAMHPRSDQPEHHI